MLSMVRLIFAVYEYVVKKDEYKTAYVVTDDLVHDTLKCGRGIGEPERHHQEFIVPQLCLERFFVDVLVLDSDQVVSAS